VLVLVSYFVSKKINSGYQKIITFFKHAAFKKEKLDTNLFLSEDFKILGNFANDMVESIHLEQEKLKKLNEELEYKIAEKTKELQEVNVFLEYKNAELEKNYFTDTLTGLRNRNRFLKDLDLHENVTALIYDIDGFKNINDFYGIKTGDFLLISLAKVIKDFADEKGMNAYRLSSDEFLITLYDDTKLKNLKEFSNDFYQEFRKKEFYDETAKIKLNVSLTSAVARGKDHILSRVDVALNYAKQNKLAYAVYNEDNPLMNKHKQNIFWREKIQYAIDNDLVEPYFQSIVNVDNVKEKKYEALIRIIDKDHIITPYQFLDIAKETKQYRYLTRIMIEKTFKRFENEDAEFSINISMLDIENKETVQFLKDKIVQYHVQNKLILEILESEDVINSDKFLTFVDSMRILGVRFALDDFGSGYSNFAFLLKMHPRFLKIDGSLIKNIQIDKNSYSIVKTIVLFAKQLNAIVIAEFVENAEIVRVLQELDVHYMQGYHFSKPSKELD
jgi:diguanylate cyclase (GGDEF)-like protein